MLESIDHGVGLIAAKLEALDLAENTIFIFTSDNGGESNVTSNAPLRGGKSDLYESGSENTRIFLRDAGYHDSLIRFDFRMGKPQDVRLMTGSGGGYNTVLHLRRDHFFLQTAKDNSVPYSSYRHGGCAYGFDKVQILTAVAKKAAGGRAKVEAAYPKLFVSDEEITAKKKPAADAVRSKPEFKQLSKQRAAANRAQQDYLLTTDEELKRLGALVKEQSR